MGTTLPVAVRAYDVAGRITEIVANSTVNFLPAVAQGVDACPGTTITSGPASRSAQNRAIFEFDSVGGNMDAAMLMCRLDGGAAAPCSSPWTIGDSGDRRPYLPGHSH